MPTMQVGDTPAWIQTSSGARTRWAVRSTSRNEQPCLWRYQGRIGGTAIGCAYACSVNQATTRVYVRPTNGATRSTAARVRADDCVKPKSCLRSRKQTSTAQRPA